MDSDKQKQSMAGALLEPSLVEPGWPEPGDHERASISVMTLMGFAFLTFNSAMAVSWWHRGLGAVSFLLFSCLGLGMLFHCLRMFTRTPPGSPRREPLKMAMWVLATMLTITFFQLLELWFLTMGQTENPIRFSEPCICAACPDPTLSENPVTEGFPTKLCQGRIIGIVQHE